MGSPNTQLDPLIQRGLINFLKSRLGLFGALRFKGKVAACTCEPCQTIAAILNGADLPEQTP